MILKIIKKTYMFLNPFNIKYVDYFADTKINFTFKKINKKSSNIEKKNDLSNMDVELESKLYSNYFWNKFIVQKSTSFISADKNHMEWHSWYKRPSFTIESCPKKIDVERSAYLQGIKRIVIFGDSLSDIGNLHKYSLDYVPKTGPYYNGMFSNGNVWAKLLENQLYKNIAVSNYSVGGATSITKKSKSIFFSLKVNILIIVKKNLKKNQMINLLL